MGLLSRRKAMRFAEMGVQREEAGDLKKAEHFFLLGIKADDSVAELHMVYGKLLMETKRPRAAEVELKKALELNPALAEAHLALGTLYHFQGNNIDAEQEYLTALRIQPDYIAAYRNLIELYKDTIQFSKVSDTAKQALQYIQDPEIRKEFIELVF